jgi:hypothetical protein
MQARIELAQIADVTRDDRRMTTARSQNDRRVDDVGCPGSTAQRRRRFR